MRDTEQMQVRKLECNRNELAEDVLAVEQNVALEVDRELLIRTTCSPGRLREWALGYLLSEGHISEPEDVESMEVGSSPLRVALASSAPIEFVPPAPVASDLIVDRSLILAFAEEVVTQAAVFHETGGTHVMAIITKAEIVALVEDISRSCALEKALGLALIEDVDFSRSLAFLSSRVPSRMVAKLARCGVPIVAAVSAPTVDAVRLAEQLDICLCGFVRADRLNVYTHGWRVGL